MRVGLQKAVNGSRSVMLEGEAELCVGGYVTMLAKEHVGAKLVLWRRIRVSHGAPTHVRVRGTKWQHVSPYGGARTVTIVVRCPHAGEEPGD